MNTQVSVMVLLEREHDRLKSQAKRLATYEVDIDDLTKLKRQWEDQLCFAPCASPLLTALDDLIKLRETEAYPITGYDELINQIHAYKHASRTLLHQAFGSSLAPYINEWGHLRKQYRKQYKQNMEPDKKLPISVQADLMRAQLQALLPTPAIPDGSSQSVEDSSQPAKQQASDASHKAIAAKLAELTQLIEEAQYPSPHTSPAEVVDMQAYRQTP